MFFVLKELVVALLLALLLAGGIIGLIALMTRSTHSRYDFIDLKPLLILGITLILLFAEGLFLFGAGRVRRQIDKTWDDVAGTIAQVQHTNQQLNKEELSQLIRKEIPGVEQFISMGEAGIDTAAMTATAYYRTLRSEVSWYIWKRIIWIAAFSLVAGFLMISDASKQARRSRAYAAYMSEY